LWGLNGDDFVDLSFSDDSFQVFWQEIPANDGHAVIDPTELFGVVIPKVMMTINNHKLFK
jgi:hypothetical protein